MKFSSLIAVTLAASSVIASQLAAVPIWTATGFDMPESAVSDPVRNRVYLSEIVGHPAAADGQGGIVALAMDGTVVDRNWVTGLDAPKGMALIDDGLLVADLTRLHLIDPDTGTVLRTINVPGAQFLNDVTGADDTAYVSDLMGGGIWRYHAGEVGLWLDEPRIPHPNGVYLDGARLLVGDWGQGLHDDFSTDVPGSLWAVDLADQSLTPVAKALGNIDGVTRDGETVFVTDWVTGDLFSVAGSGAVTRVDHYPAGLADISATGETLYLPEMLEGRLSAVRLTD